MKTKTLKTLIATASIVVAVSTSAFATPPAVEKLCDYTAGLAELAVKSKQAGVPYIDSVREFNHGFNSTKWQHSANKPSWRHWFDEVIRNAYKSGLEGADDERALTYGQCVQDFKNDADAADVPNKADEPDPDLRSDPNQATTPDASL
jgi:hypothetical protein